MTVQLGSWSMRPATQCDPTFLLDLHRTTMRAVIERRGVGMKTGKRVISRSDSPSATYTY
jgi:hypothetical protein